MHGNHHDEVRDPVCGMTVSVAAARAADLSVEHEGREYAFCRAGCKRAFLESPTEFTTAAVRQAAMAVGGNGTLAIDEGMRRWYDSCSCCLSDAYPDVKAALDAERAEHHEPPPPVGICEVAENT